MNAEEEQNSQESKNDKNSALVSAETSTKIIRLITVIVYLFSVSMAAIMLSLYYLFFWNPTVQPGPQRLVDPIQYHFAELYFNVTQREFSENQTGKLRENSFKGKQKKALPPGKWVKQKSSAACRENQKPKRKKEKGKRQKRKRKM